MTFKFRGHNYTTRFRFAIKSRLSKWFGAYRWPVTLWLSHEDDCCDYWTSKGMVEAIMQDDLLSIKKKG